jgi:hypothetical protein
VAVATAKVARVPMAVEAAKNRRSGVMANSSCLFWLVVNVHAMVVVLCTVHYPELAPSLPDDASGHP